MCGGCITERQDHASRLMSWSFSANSLMQSLLHVVGRIRAEFCNPKHELNVADAFVSQNTNTITFPVELHTFGGEGGALSEELSVSVPIQLGLFQELTLCRLMSYIYIYIYIYMSYRTANLQMLHFKYLFNNCPY
jgi:hypothetical protein